MMIKNALKYARKVAGTNHETTCEDLDYIGIAWTRKCMVFALICKRKSLPYKMISITRI